MAWVLQGTARGEKVTAFKEVEMRKVLGCVVVGVLGCTGVVEGQRNFIDGSSSIVADAENSRLQIFLPISALDNEIRMTCTDSWVNDKGDNQCPHLDRVRAALHDFQHVLREWMHPHEEIELDFESCPDAAMTMTLSGGIEISNCTNQTLVIRGAYEER